MNRNSLIAKVKAVNAVHAAANKFSVALHEIFAPLVGQSIVRTDGKLFAKYDKFVPKLSQTGPSCYFNNSQYTLSWTIKTSEHVIGEGHSLYYSVSIYVGSLDGAVLTSINTPEILKDDFTVDDVERQRLIVRYAKSAYEAAKSALHPFEE